MIFTIINFLILAGLVYFFSRKKINAYFAGQRQALERQIQSAAEELQEVEAEYEKISKKMDSLDDTIAGIRRDAENEIEHETRKIRESTDEFVSKMKQDLESRIEQETQKAKRQIEQELLSKALEQAEVELRSKMRSENESWTQQMMSTESDSSGKENYAS